MASDLLNLAKLELAKRPEFQQFQPRSLYRFKFSAKRNETKENEGIMLTLATCEFIMLPSLSRHNKIGGFHYGIPFCGNCDSIETVISCFSRYELTYFQTLSNLRKVHFFRQ